jgi:hypothetical protein
MADVHANCKVIASVRTRKEDDAICQSRGELWRRAAQQRAWLGQSEAVRAGPAGRGPVPVPSRPVPSRPARTIRTRTRQGPCRSTLICSAAVLHLHAPCGLGCEPRRNAAVRLWFLSVRTCMRRGRSPYLRHDHTSALPSKPARTGPRLYSVHCTDLTQTMGCEPGQRGQRWSWPRPGSGCWCVARFRAKGLRQIDLNSEFIRFYQFLPQEETNMRNVPTHTYVEG